MSIQEQMEVVNKFLTTLYSPTDYILFRLIGGGKVIGAPLIVDRLWTVPLSQQQVRWMSNLNKLGAHCYFGVCPRDGDDKTLPITINTLWVDIDDKLPEGLLNGVEDAIIRIAWKTPPPTMIIKSGHGVHAYWKIKSETLNNITSIARSVLRGLAKTVGGDMVWDATRLMRLPGFYNTKRKPWPVVEIYSYNPDAVYMIEEFQGNVSSAKLDDKLEQLIEQGAKGKFASRSEADWAVICGLVENGYTDEEIRTIFTNKQHGISEKYFANQSKERGGGDKYLQFTIKKARRLIK